MIKNMEYKVRERMRVKKTSAVRSSTPCTWARSVGHSVQALNRKGYERPAENRSGCGVSSASLRDPLDEELFIMTVTILHSVFPCFSRILSRHGRVDMKYNCRITVDDKHVDKQDQCHQVMFTMGSSNNGLVVLENFHERVLDCYYNPVAFDGRFQHWVQDHPSSTSDRISIVAYLTDTPSYYMHSPLPYCELQHWIAKMCSGTFAGASQSLPSGLLSDFLGRKIFLGPGPGRFS